MRSFKSKADRAGLGPSSMSTPFLSIMARHFLAVAGARSITEAGRALHVAPSAVSRQIAQIEAEMGCRLFVRQSRGMQLTEAGERLLAWLTAVQREAEAVRQEVRGLGSALARQLILGCTEGLTTAFVPALMARFRQQMPGARLSLRVGDARQVDHWLRQGEVDVGLRFATRPVEGLRVAASAMAPILAIVGGDHALARDECIGVAELARQALALPEGDSTVRQALDEACARAGTHYRAACTGNLPALIVLAQRGGLVMLGSRLSVMHGLDDGSLKTLAVTDRAFEERKVQLLVREGRPPGEAAQHFLALARAALEQGAAAI